MWPLSAAEKNIPRGRLYNLPARCILGLSPDGQVLLLRVMQSNGAYRALHDIVHANRTFWLPGIHPGS